MARTIRTEKFLNALAERTIDNTRMLRRGIDQRRNGMEDLYGQPFIVYGDASNPATFYISVSKDYIYFEQYAFKFVIMPYQTTVKGGTDSAVVKVYSKNLAIDGGNITPNPHDHAVDAHTHNLIAGKTFVPTTSKNWRVVIADVDITEYLQEQVADINNGWLGDKGQGIYPNNKLEDSDDRVNFYDILDVASVMDAEGKTAERDALLKPELKEVQIISDAPFGIQAYLYLKYSHLNR